VGSLDEIQTQFFYFFKRLFIMTWTHNMQIFREIPFIKPQNNTSPTLKHLETMKNDK